jgi:hypothetical protein
MILSESVDSWGLPVSEAISKKLWTTDYRKIKFQGEEISRKEEEWMNTVFAKAGE